jgi:Holliday junction DNA helicase RuvA
LGLFKNLITVSGIGPRIALAVLSTLNPEQLISAIEGGNIDLLSQVPGIGKKTAGRIVLELKGKLEKEWGGVIAPSLKQEDADVVAALTSLGYSLREATQAVAAVSDSKEISLEDRVKLALQQLART